MQAKPCGLLDVDGYYDSLMKFLDHTVAEKIIRAEHHSMILIDDYSRALLVKMESFRVPLIKKWLELGN